MTARTPWRLLWEEIDRAMAEFGHTYTKGMEQFLKHVGVAMRSYGRAVDPGSFDEYGLYRMEEVDLPGAEDEVVLDDVDIDQLEEPE